jgi:hypothetical protein
MGPHFATQTDALGHCSIAVIILVDGARIAYRKERG